MSFDNRGEKFALDSLEGQRRWQTEYRRIVDDASIADPTGRQYVGTSIPRNDVLYKVRGRAKYAANITMPGVLHGHIVRSRYPYAKIKGVDISQAAKLPGVHSIVSAADIPDEKLHIGRFVKDLPIFAKDVVRYVGEPIAAVCADSAQIAEQAASLVEVQYEPMVPVLSPEEALRPDAPKLHPTGNVLVDFSNARGDVKQAFKDADIIVEDTYTTAPIDHCFLEAQSGISFIDESGVLTLIVTTQYPHVHHKQIAELTGLPTEKIRVIQSVVGGAFGGKIDLTIELACCMMTLRTGRPVRMALDREEVFSATTKRHAMTIRQRMGAKSDGRIVAFDMDVLADGGAYSSSSIIVAGRCVVHATLPYDIPNLQMRMRTTYTNNIVAGAMRSFGVVKIAFATESQIDKIARAVGKSPIEIRRMNAVVDGTVSATGQVLRDVGFVKTLDEIERIYEQRKRELAVDEGGTVVSGLGVACLGYGIGYSGIRNPSTARIEVQPSGQVIAHCGTPDIGTGSDTTMAQIVAESAGINIARVRVISGDSVETDDSGPTSASRTTYFSGSAARIAGEDFRKQFCERVAQAFDVAVDTVRLRSDTVFVNNQAYSFEECCRRLGAALAEIRAYGVFDPDSRLDLKSFRGDPYPTYTYATHLAEIQLDTETGKVSVPNYWASHDAGELVNPIGAEGQIEGGVVMGLGMALYERIVRDGGYIQNPSYRDYLLVGPKEAPTRISTTFVTNTDPTGPFGAKGVAEASLIPVPAAIANALHDAVGIRPTQLPMDAESVHSLLQRKKG